MSRFIDYTFLAIAGPAIPRPCADRDSTNECTLSLLPVEIHRSLSAFELRAVRHLLRNCQGSFDNSLHIRDPFQSATVIPPGCAASNYRNGSQQKDVPDENQV
jgi:hypothetical protein